MKLAVVINTCALRQNTEKRYSQRAGFIYSTILPRLVGDPDVGAIAIAGEFEPDAYGDHRFTYVPVTNTFGNCRDVLAQRQAGWEKVRRTNPDAVLFLMDDHVPAEHFFGSVSASLREHQWEVFSPNRRSVETGARLNTGWSDAGTPDPMGPYLHTHGIVLTPRALTACPWIGLTPLYKFDLLHTMWFNDKGLKIYVEPNVFVEDLVE